MEASREKAWGYLTDIEKQSIYLTLGQGNSCTESGIIMGMTHYKFLELKGRSETYFKMFTDYFDKHKQLIRPNLNLLPAFRDFIEGCLEKRLSYDEACRYAGEGHWSTKAIRQSQITQCMQILIKSENEWDNDLAKLLIEFDRWNYERILPQELRAPTPYKRKSNRQAKAYFTYLRKIPKGELLKLSHTLWYNSKDPNKLWYITLISEDYDRGFGVIPIQRTKKNLNDLTIKRIYVFPNILRAEEFGLMIIRQPHILTPKDGLNFWKEYQTIIQDALNYERIDHTTKIKDFYDEQFKNNYCQPTSKRQ